VDTARHVILSTPRHPPHARHVIHHRHGIHHTHATSSTTRTPHPPPPPRHPPDARHVIHHRHVINHTHATPSTSTTRTPRHPPPPHARHVIQRTPRHAIHRSPRHPPLARHVIHCVPRVSIRLPFTQDMRVQMRVDDVASDVGEALSAGGGAGGCRVILHRVRRLTYHCSRAWQILLNYSTS